MPEKQLPAELMRLLGQGEAQAFEGLRLIRAFVRIVDPTIRIAVIELAEKLAAAATNEAA
jgi:hypothetical protein